MHTHNHLYRNESGHDHDHTHGALDPALLTTERGIWAIKASLFALLATALLQLGIVLATSSVGLLADTLHNFGDAATAVPLWVAFSLARKQATKRFTYGYGRVEDVAGIIILFLMLFSGLIAGGAALLGLFHPPQIEYPLGVACGSLVGFLGNEAVARFRIRVGRQIGSVALIADGNHARADGMTSLGVLVGVIGVWLGYPQADPLVGLVISMVIFKIVWDSGKSILSRLLDGIDPEVIDEIVHAAHEHVPGVLEVTNVRVRWLGHRMLAEVNITVQSNIPVEEGHEIAREVRHQLLHHLPYLGNAVIHVDPANASGEHHHRIGEHDHDELPTHSHT